MSWIIRAARIFKEGSNNGKSDVKRGKTDPMTKLRIALERHVSLAPGTSETETELVYQALVPELYLKSELDMLLLEAAKMDNWFIMANHKTTVFNPENIQLK